MIGVLERRNELDSSMEIFALYSTINDSVRRKKSLCSDRPINGDGLWNTIFKEKLAYMHSDI